MQLFLRFGFRKCSKRTFGKHPDEYFWNKLAMYIIIIFIPSVSIIKLVHILSYYNVWVYLIKVYIYIHVSTVRHLDHMNKYVRHLLKHGFLRKTHIDKISNLFLHNCLVSSEISSELLSIFWWFRTFLWKIIKRLPSFLKVFYLQANFQGNVAAKTS